MVQPSGVSLLALEKRPVLVVRVGTSLDGALVPGATVGWGARGTQGVVDDTARSILSLEELGSIPVGIAHLNGEDSVLVTSVNHLGGPLTSGNLELPQGNTTLSRSDIRLESLDDGDEFVKGGITRGGSFQHLLNVFTSVSTLASISDNWEGIRDRSILGLELNPTILGPSGHGKVLEVVGVGEVPLGGDLDWLASLDSEGHKGARSAIEGHDGFLSWGEN